MAEQHREVDSGARKRGHLYVVATPIGNLNDITLRAIDVLKAVDVVAAEDTRHSRGLLTHLGIQKQMISLHDHNEESRIDEVARMLDQGLSVALVTDAGTPLISDPGFRLVRELRSQGFSVVPLPGPCAAIAALCASGLPTDEFTFFGFAPSRQQARRNFLESLAEREATLVFYESPQRIADFLADARDLLGGDREACVAKEISKVYERFVTDTLDVLAQAFPASVSHKGEYVVMIAGKRKHPDHSAAPSDVMALLRTAARYLPPKQACALVAEMTGADKKSLYQQWVVERGE